MVVSAGLFPEALKRKAVDRVKSSGLSEARVAAELGCKRRSFAARWPSSGGWRRGRRSASARQRRPCRHRHLAGDQAPKPVIRTMLPEAPSEIVVSNHAFPPGGSTRVVISPRGR